MHLGRTKDLGELATQPESSLTRGDKIEDETI